MTNYVYSTFLFYWLYDPQKFIANLQYVRKYREVIQGGYFKSVSFYFCVYTMLFYYRVGVLDYRQSEACIWAPPWVPVLPTAACSMCLEKIE